MITIIDYGMGNLGSILNMFRRLKIEAEITSDFNTISGAEKLIVPGVGTFDAAMKKMNDSGLRDVLNRKALIEKVPVLGICLGMQLLTDSSEEGHSSGLGWIPGRTLRFDFKNRQDLKIPHMGWNEVIQSNPSPLTQGFEGEMRFYFVHSFYVKPESERYSFLKSHHGFEFDAGIQKENIFGVQFHPEKSHRFGMKLLQNFANI